MRWRGRGVCIGLALLALCLVAAPAAGQTPRAGRLPPKIKHVDPVTTGQAAVRGIVVLRITVGMNGRVTDARVLRSVPALEQAALDAVRQWEYDARDMKWPILANVTLRFEPPRPPAATAPPGRSAPGPGSRQPNARVTSPPAAGAAAAAPAPAPCPPSASSSPDPQRQALRQQAFQNATTGRLGFAHKDVDALLALDPCDADAHFARGLAFFVGNAAAAVKSFSQAIQSQPTAARFYRGLAWASLVAGDYAAASKAFDQLVRLEPEDAEAYRGRGWSAMHLGAYDRAISDFTEVVRRTPANAETLSVRGAAYYFVGRVPEARADFSKSLTLGRKPNGAVTYNTLILDDWTRHRRLQTAIDARLQRDPNDINGWLAFGAVGYHADNPAIRSASDAFDRAVKTRADDVDALMYRALAGYNRGTVVSDLTEVIRLKPDHSQAYFQRSLLLALDTRTLPNAIADCRKAFQLAGANPQFDAVCQQLELNQRMQEIRKEQERLAEPQRQRDRDVVALLFTFAAVQILTRERDPNAPIDWPDWFPPEDDPRRRRR